MCTQRYAGEHPAAHKQQRTTTTHDIRCEMTGGGLTHTLVSLRDGLRSACAPCAARDARAAKRNFGDPAGGKSGWFRGGFKIVKGSLPQAEFKVVKVSDLLENQPPPYGRSATHTLHTQEIKDLAFRMGRGCAVCLCGVYAQGLPSHSPDYAH